MQDNDAQRIGQAKQKILSLNKKDIDMVRSFINPPPKILTTLQLLFLILSDDIKQWNDIRKQMMNIQFINRLINFDTSKLSENQIKKIHKFIKDNNMGSDEAMQQYRKVSAICPGILGWCLAVSHYQ